MPEGIDSHPHSCAKGAFVAPFLIGLPRPVDPERLPPRLREMYTSPPLNNAWVPHTAELTRTNLRYSCSWR